MAFLTRRSMLSSTAMTLALSGLPAQAQTPSTAAPDTDWRT
jgi:hypothetical protein